jgi:multidrug efflux pump
VIDRDAVARHGLTMRAVTTALNNAYGQRQVSTIYNPLNQYRVVMEAMPDYLQGPESLARLTLVTPAGGLVPLSALARFESTLAPLSVSHQGGSAAATISFALPEGAPSARPPRPSTRRWPASACRWASAPASRARPAPSRSR